MQNTTKRPLVILLIIQFLVMVGFGIVIPILPFFVTKLGGGALSLGIFMSVYSIMQFIFAPIWGRLSDRIGRRPVLIMGLSGYGITFIMFGLISNLYLLIILRALAGMVSSATLPTAMAYLADITEGADRSKKMGMLGASMGMGMVFGPAIGGWLGIYGFSVPFFVAGALAICLLPVIGLFLPESLKRGSSDSASHQRLKFSFAIVKDPLFALFAVSFAKSFCMSMFESTFALFAAAKVGFGPEKMGIVFAILGIFAVIVQGGLIGPLVKKFGEVTLVRVGAVFAACGLFFIVLSQNAVVLVVSTIIFMIGNSLMTPTSSSLVSKQSSLGQGTSLGFFQAFASLGRVFGPITGGALFDLNVGLPYSTAAVVLLLMLITAGRKISLNVQTPLAEK
jgi:multidrug resistance protein